MWARTFWGLLANTISLEHGVKPKNGLASFRRWCNKRRLFSAPNDLIGIAPQETEVADALVVLRGCPFVSLLCQRADKNWEVICGSVHVLDGSLEAESPDDRLGCPHYDEHHAEWGMAEEFILS